MDPVEHFRQLVADNIRKIGEDRDFIGLSRTWARESIRHSYAQNFTWLGRPVIQVPQDLYAIQELIWICRPDLIIETGIAHGGSLVTSASMLALLDYCDAVTSGTVLDPKASPVGSARGRLPHRVHRLVPKAVQPRAGEPDRAGAAHQQPVDLPGIGRLPVARAVLEQRPTGDFEPRRSPCFERRRQARLGPDGDDPPHPPPANSAAIETGARDSNSAASARGPASSPAGNTTSPSIRAPPFSLNRAARMISARPSA